MRIFGGHDYFDSALAYGQDPAVVLQRTPMADADVVPFGETDLQPMLLETVKFQGGGREAWRRENDFWTRQHVHRFTPAAIWFAGRRYGGVHVSTHSAGSPYHAELSSDWHWDCDGFLSFLDGIGAKLIRGDEWSVKHSLAAANVEEHFSREPSRAETDWLIENRVSIAVWCSSTAARNSVGWKRDTGWKFDVDGLGKMGFARKLDPFAAFQELAMWVGGVLPRPGNPMVEISGEKVMVAKHGMDEWSFRTPPGPKR